MVNRETIKQQVSAVLGYSQDIPEPQVDELIDTWQEAKRDFIELFNGELIYEFPRKVSFEIGPKEKMLRVQDFISLVRNTYGNDALADFIEMNKEGFFSNKVMNNYEHETITIMQGMKLLKAFKFFEDDAVTLNKLQSAASMIIQENKIEGTLCLSVHPLDYLSSSENNHNWRSCHALDGEYRAGNLSYMQDKSTVVCYLRSDRMERLPNFPPEVPWNSKKWRVLLFFSDSWDLLFAGRQYPFSTESGIEFVKNDLLASVGLTGWSDWCGELIKEYNNAGLQFYFSSPYIPIGRKMRSLNEIIVDAEGSLHYNDLLHSTCYTPIYSYRVKQMTFPSPFEKNNEVMHATKSNTVVHIGHKCTCIRCGRNQINMTESMMCDDCELEYGTEDREGFGTCPCCGRRFIFDDGGWVESASGGEGEVICEDCFEDYANQCQCCGAWFYTDDMTWDRDIEGYVCRFCLEDRE